MHLSILIIVSETGQNTEYYVLVLALLFGSKYLFTNLKSYIISTNVIRHGQRTPIRNKEKTLSKKKYFSFLHFFNLVVHGVVFKKMLLLT